MTVERLGPKGAGPFFPLDGSRSALSALSVGIHTTFGTLCAAYIARESTIVSRWRGRLSFFKVFRSLFAHSGA
jgi:hypothetical protein